MNFINKKILKEFDELLSKYKLSSVSHFETRDVEQVMEKPRIQVHDKHIQINLTIPDYFDEEKENLSCLQNLLNSQE